MGWLDSGGGDGWDMLSPDQQQMILESEEDTMTKRITVDPNNGRTTVQGGPLDPSPRPSDSKAVDAAQGCLIFLLLALIGSGAIWAIVKVWESILSTF